MFIEDLVNPQASPCKHSEKKLWIWNLSSYFLYKISEFYSFGELINNYGFQDFNSIINSGNRRHSKYIKKVMRIGLTVCATNKFISEEIKVKAQKYKDAPLYYVVF